MARAMTGTGLRITPEELADVSEAGLRHMSQTAKIAWSRARMDLLSIQPYTAPDDVLRQMMQGTVEMWANAITVIDGVAARRYGSAGVVIPRREEA